tara:strand:+ start:110 stop:277 length:168 start_codon:yes stop_codon:yes gene_type:complete
MEDMAYVNSIFKVFAVNLGALIFSSIDGINSFLQTIVLLLTIGYTGLLIYKQLNK